MKDEFLWQVALVYAYWRLAKERAFTVFSNAIKYFAGSDED